MRIRHKPTGITAACQHDLALSGKALQPAHGFYAPSPLVGDHDGAYMLHCTMEGNSMTKIIRSTGIGEFFNIMGSAISTASALETGRRPNTRDLRRLGIDPVRLNAVR